MTNASSVVSTELAPIIAVLATTPSRWVHLADRLPAALFNLPAAPGEWSALDCLHHLLDAETGLYPPRLAAFQAGQDFPAFDPKANAGAYQGQTPAQLAATFAAQRAANLVLFDTLASADLERTVRHPSFGPVTLLQMLQSWAAHDFNHTTQAEDAIMQPFIAGCGPWRGYFTAHDRTPQEG